MDEFKKHIDGGSEEMLVAINPIGGIYREMEHLKTFLNTMLLLEYSVLPVSVVIRCSCTVLQLHWEPS